VPNAFDVLFLFFDCHVDLEVLLGLLFALELRGTLAPAHFGCAMKWMAPISYRLSPAAISCNALAVPFQSSHVQRPDVVLRVWSGWNASPAPPAVQSMGDAWIRSRRSLAFRAPSAIVQGSYSVLINPAHPDVGQFIVEATTPYSFDARLIKIPGV